MVEWRSISKHTWRAVKPHKWMFFATFFLFVLGQVLGWVILPIFLERIVDVISQATTRESVLGELLNLVYQYGWLLFVQFLLYRSFDLTFFTVQRKILRNLINNAYDAIMQHGYSFFANNFAGSLVAKAKRYRTAFEVIHDQLVFQFVSSGVVAAGMIIVIYTRSPPLAMIFLTWMILFIIISQAMAWYRVRYDVIEAQADSNVTAELADTVTNALSVKMFARTKDEHNRFYDATLKQEKALANSWNFTIIMMVVQGILAGAFEVISLYYSIILWEQGAISTGVVVLLQAYIAAIIGKVWQLGKALARVMKSVTNMDEMVQIMEEPISIKEPTEPNHLSNVQGAIRYDDITFSYEKQKVYDKFTLAIKPGEKIGLVGRSGSGKSTLTKLLLRFEDVQEGAVLIDGHDIRRIKKEELRRYVAYVPQEPLLFHRSIQENISYGKPGATKQEIIAAAKKAHAHEFIEKLEQGYDTLVGERGVKLSGGERQRVAIARAMLKDAPILVLDEATSSLDARSEKLIQEAFEQLMKGRTTIVIAHRLATVQRLDKIVVLKEGKIVEEGTHEELIKNKSEYYQLYTHQQL